MMDMVKYLIGLFVIFTLVSCGNDFRVECDEIRDLGEFYMLESSKDFIPYTNDINKIIFSDSLGNELDGKVLRNTLSLGWSQNSYKPCPFNENIMVSYIHEPESKWFDLAFEDLDLQFDLKVEVDIESEYNVQNPISDRFWLLLYCCSEDASRKLLYQKNFRLIDRLENKSLLGEIDFFDVFKIHGEIFTNVYVFGSSNNNSYLFYYNTKIGIIGFKDRGNPEIDYKFERFGYK